MTQSIHQAPYPSGACSNHRNWLTGPGATHSRPLGPAWAPPARRSRRHARTRRVGLYLVMLAPRPAADRQRLVEGSRRQLRAAYGFMGAQTDAERGFSDNDAAVEARRRRNRSIRCAICCAICARAVPRCQPPVVPTTMASPIRWRQRWLKSAPTWLKRRVARR